MARILVADDDPDVVQFLASALGAEGYEVHTAGTVPAALAAIRSVPVDVVILDMGMEGLDQGAPAKALREASAGAGPRVLILTGRDLRRETVRGTLKGADASLEKGCSVDQLMLTVQRLVRKAPSE